MQTEELIYGIKNGNNQLIAKAISLVENDLEKGYKLLTQLDSNQSSVIIGITGPPGAGKSTIINGMISAFIQQNKKVAIVAVDPTSPFSKGSLLGDRIRMSQHFLNSSVYIRSVATRGSLGGLSSRIFEIIDILKSSNFDYIIIETVGVGQSEVEIAGLADTTILVLVPESGDEVQNIKSGVMEIADIFVLNKSDREGSDAFYKNLCNISYNISNDDWKIPVVKTVGISDSGIPELLDKINLHQTTSHSNNKKIKILAEKALQLIKDARTQDIQIDDLENQIRLSSLQSKFNLYSFVNQYI